MPKPVSNRLGLISIDSALRMIVARRIYSGRVTPMGCHITIQEVGHADFPRHPDPPDKPAEVTVGSDGLLIATRCPDFGDVDLEAWSGDPGRPQAGWQTVFEGHIKTQARGFDIGTATATTFHVNVAPGSYAFRADIHRGSDGLIDGVRFIFPESPELSGEIRE